MIKVWKGTHPNGNSDLFAKKPDYKSWKWEEVEVDACFVLVNDDYPEEGGGPVSIHHTLEGAEKAGKALKRAYEIDVWEIET